MAVKRCRETSALPHRARRARSGRRNRPEGCQEVQAAFPDPVNAVPPTSLRWRARKRGAEPDGWEPDGGGFKEHGGRGEGQRATDRPRASSRAPRASCSSERWPPSPLPCCFALAPQASCRFSTRSVSKIFPEKAGEAARDAEPDRSLHTGEETSCRAVIEIRPRGSNSRTDRRQQESTFPCSSVTRQGLVTRSRSSCEAKSSGRNGTLMASGGGVSVPAMKVRSGPGRRCFE